MDKTKKLSICTYRKEDSRVGNRCCGPQNKPLSYMIRSTLHNFVNQHGNGLFKTLFKYKDNISIVTDALLSIV